MKSLLAVLYLSAAVLTYGVYINVTDNTEFCGAAPKFTYSTDWDRRSEIGAWFTCSKKYGPDQIKSMAAGAFWPVYWGGKVSIYVMGGWKPQ